MQYTMGTYLGTEKKKIIECIPRDVPEREKVKKNTYEVVEESSARTSEAEVVGGLRKKPLFGGRRRLRNLGIISKKQRKINYVK